MEFSPSWLIQGEGAVSILDCHWADWDFMAAELEMWAAGCCVCQRPVSCFRLLETHCHPSGTLSHSHSSFLFCPVYTPPFLFFLPPPLFTLFFLSFSSLWPLTPSLSALSHPRCLLSHWPISPSPRVWCVCLVWPFRRRRTRRSGRGSRRRHRGETTDASVR